MIATAADVRKDCRVCGGSFLPFMSTQVVCGVKCATKLPRLTRATDKRATRARLKDLQPLSYWLRLAQAQVNRYVRLRDAELGCASCDKPATWDGQWHASHFRSVGAASSLRFHLWNVHKSCSICNNWKSGNLSEYEPRLRARIGDDKVDWLRTQNQLASYSREYLQRLSAVMRKRANRLERR